MQSTVNDGKVNDINGESPLLSILFKSKWMTNTLTTNSNVYDNYQCVQM